MSAPRARGVAVGLLATFVLVLGAVPASRSRLDRLLVLSVVLYAGFHARGALGVGVRPAPAEAEPGWRDSAAAEEQDVRLARLDASLALGAESGEHFWKVTRPLLRRLAADRLRVRHGIDVTADPAGARRQMGEELWQMFSAPAEHDGPPPGRERLALLVDRLDRL